MANSYIFSLLYWPYQWDTLASILDAALRRDVQGIVEGIGGIASSPPPPPPPVPVTRRDLESTLGIKCGDILDSGKANLTEMIPVFEGLLQSSRYFGGAYMGLARCAQWKLPAKERYNGDFKVKTRRGVMIINNSYDPITPLVSARNLTGLLEGSALLHQDGAYGVRPIASLAVDLAANLYASTLRKLKSQLALPKLLRNTSTKGFCPGPMPRVLLIFPRSPTRPAGKKLWSSTSNTEGENFATGK